MRAVVERVSRAAVTVDDEVVGSIAGGLLVYLGVADGDSTADGDYLVNKVSQLRIFPDDEGRMNRNVVEAGGTLLVISAFTLQADARKGRRPSFDAAANPQAAESLYQYVCDQLRAKGLRVEQGRFRTMMHVASVGDGPVVILLDSTKLF